MGGKNDRVGKNEGITTEYIQEVMKDILKILGEPSREYKDRVFRMLLNDPVVALEVYNAMNDSEYDDPNDLKKGLSILCVST